MKTIIYAWRFLVRLKSYTIINLIGLSLSLACCIILLRYINSELSVDDPLAELIWFENYV